MKRLSRIEFIFQTFQQTANGLIYENAIHFNYFFLQMVNYKLNFNYK